MKDLKGTKTEKNLLEAFAGESMARNKYTYYAAVARMEGYHQIAEIFEETANNEKEHAKLHYKFLQGIGSTVDNLKDAASGENSEWDSMYPRMAAEAREEGFEEIAQVFEGIAKIEKEHEERFKKLLESIEKDRVFKRENSIKWKCRNCGHIHEGEEAPNTCPVCKHSQGFFEELSENY